MGPTQETVAQRKELMAAVIAEHPHRWAAQLATDPDAGWHIGRLYLAGLLTREQRDAAKKFATATRRYEAFLLGPRNAGALDPNAPGGMPTEDDADYERRFNRAKREYDRQYHAVAECGRDVAKAVAAALNDRCADLKRLKFGLDALARIG